MRQRGFRGTAGPAYQVPLYQFASAPPAPSQCPNCRAGRGNLCYPRRIYRADELADVCGGQAIAEGLRRNGDLVPRQEERRCTIFSASDVDHALEGLETGRIRLWVVLLAARLDRKPTDAEIEAEGRRLGHLGPVSTATDGPRRRGLFKRGRK